MLAAKKRNAPLRLVKIKTRAEKKKDKKVTPTKKHEESETIIEGERFWRPADSYGWYGTSSVGGDSRFFAF